jgi:hypothetical protein
MILMSRNVFNEAAILIATRKEAELFAPPLIQTQAEQRRHERRSSSPSLRPTSAGWRSDATSTRAMSSTSTTSTCKADGEDGEEGGEAEKKRRKAFIKVQLNGPSTIDEDDRWDDLWLTIDE